MKDFIQNQIDSIRKYEKVVFIKKPIKALSLLHIFFSSFNDSEKIKLMLEWSEQLEKIENEPETLHIRKEINNSMNILANIFFKGNDESIKCALQCLENECIKIQEEIDILSQPAEVVTNTERNQKLTSDKNINPNADFTSNKQRVQFSI